MKRLYWRPRKASWKTVLFIALIAAAALFIVERNKSAASDPLHETKLAAARRAEQAMAAIKQERLRKGHAIDLELDPAESGMIGKTLTPVTSVSGHLAAKQITVNPNFAAAVVEMLGQAGVHTGDVVAVGCSGSFPALNVAVFTALEEMKVQPIVICSAAGSQFGANIPDLMWPDMERLLHERGITSFRSVAASLGGYEDHAAGMSDEGKRMIREAIERSGLELLESKSYDDSLAERMALYDQYAEGKQVKAYINVGGGTVSVGRSLGKHLYRPGLNHAPPSGAEDIDSVMNRFARRGAAVIHLVQTRDLATAFGFSTSPTESPRVGQGDVFGKPAHNRWLAAALLVVILVVLRAFVLTPNGTDLVNLLIRKITPRRKHSIPADRRSSGELMV